MAHSCPDCGYLCHCGGDIDDCEFEGTPEQSRCVHCPIDDYEPDDVPVDNSHEEELKP